MNSYTLSQKADADIEQIAAVSLQRWGLARAEKYILSLHDAFNRLADFPELGRDASHIRHGYRATEITSHIAFYRTTEAGVLIIRVLHARMDPRRHL